MIETAEQYQKAQNEQCMLQRLVTWMVHTDARPAAIERIKRALRRQ